MAGFLIFLIFLIKTEGKSVEAVNSNDGSNTSGHRFEVTLSDGMEAFLMKEELKVPESYHLREKEFQNPT